MATQTDDDIRILLYELYISPLALRLLRKRTRRHYHRQWDDRRDIRIEAQSFMSFACFVIFLCSTVRWASPAFHPSDPALGRLLLLAPPVLSGVAWLGRLVLCGPCLVSARPHSRPLAPCSRGRNKLYCPTGHGAKAGEGGEGRRGGRKGRKLVFPE